MDPGHRGALTTGGLLPLEKSGKASLRRQDAC